MGGREEVVVHNVTLHDLDSASARPQVLQKMCGGLAGWEGV